MEHIKLAIIGGGSSYTPELVEGVILHKNTLPIGEIVLIDIPIGEGKVQIITEFAKRMIQKAGLSIKISYTLDRKEGLKDADFVITQFRVGGLEAREKDEHIPLKYGTIGQETTGPGGCFKALRTIPVILDICKDMQDICPDAWLINFTNPAGIITEAVTKFTLIKSIGLCNVPINMWHDAAERLQVPVEELDCRMIGLNHLSMMNHAYYQGIDRIEEIVKVRKKEGIVKNIDKKETMNIVEERMKGLLSPYMQYYYLEKEMIAEEKEKVFSGEGTRAEQVKRTEMQLFETYRDKNLNEKPEALAKRGGARYSEAAIKLINSIYNNAGDVQVVDVVNGKTIPELPEDAVIEINCRIGREGAVPLPTEGLPEVIKGLVCQVKAYERLTIEAVIHGDKDKVFLALLNNPLVHDARDAEDILAEMMEAHKQYLSVFFGG
jgi:6-phospho-beta-glucosidase